MGCLRIYELENLRTDEDHPEISGQVEFSNSIILKFTPTYTATTLSRLSGDLVQEIKDQNGKTRTSYVYDEYGQKILRKTLDTDGLTILKLEQYNYSLSRDNGNASGTVIACPVVAGSIESQAGLGADKGYEYGLYGMNRLGVYHKPCSSCPNDKYTYELKDATGSVRAVIGSEKTAANTVELISYTSYYAYGEVITSMSQSLINTTTKRYGYQGEWAEQNEQTGLIEFELRQYDPEIGRWLSPDPMHQHFSPYLAMGNNPVSGVDPDGGQSGPVGGSAAFASAYGAAMNAAKQAVINAAVISGIITGVGTLIRGGASNTLYVGDITLSGKDLTKNPIDYIDATKIKTFNEFKNAILVKTDEKDYSNTLICNHGVGGQFRTFGNYVFSPDPNAKLCDGFKGGTQLNNEDSKSVLKLLNEKLPKNSNIV
ncbi:MAG: RHS repeat domain-containing protein, partial [Fusobacteriaceae bacterium]